MTEPALERREERERRGARATVQHYLPDLIYGASDGIVTTLAVVSGVVGASLPVRVILILGFANLLADGFSMGASNYLASRSRPRAEDRPGHAEAARHGLATLLGFVTAGGVPLLAYLTPWTAGWTFPIAVGLALATLLVIGASRALFTDRGWIRAGVEMLLVGVLAAAVAYGVGVAGARLTGSGLHAA